MSDYYSHIGLKYNQRTAYKSSIHERDSWTCQACGAPAQEVDHIIPWVISHDSSKSNLRAIYIKCNRQLRRPCTLPVGHLPTIPWEKYGDYLQREISVCYVKRR